MKLRMRGLYHIKDEFFDYVDDPFLMHNKEDGRLRPHFLAMRDRRNSAILWMVPTSTRYEKFKGIYDKKIANKGICTTIVLGDCCGTDGAYLIQNAFPIICRYIDHEHIVNGRPVTIHNALTDNVISYLRRNRSIQSKGRGELFQTDIDRIYRMMVNDVREGESY